MKKILPWLVLALVAAAAPLRGEEALGDDQERFLDALRRGGELSKAGKFLEALDRYDEAVALKPGDPLGHLSRGLLLMGIWRYPEARASLARTLELDPGNAPAMVWMGRCEIYDLEYVRCFDWLKKAMERVPEDPDALAVLGLLLIHLDDLDRAWEVLGKVLAAQPDHAFAQVCRGHIRLLRKDPLEAARDFAACIKANRYNAAAYVGLGQALSTLDRTQEAFRVLTEGIRRNRFIPGLHSTRAFVQFKLKRVPDSMRDYREALDLDAEYTGGHGIYCYFDATESEGLWPAGEARVALRAAVRAMEEGNAAEAARRGDAALAAAPSNLLALLVRGAAAYALEDHATTLACARKALGVEPDAPLPHVLFFAGTGLKQEVKKLELSREDFYARFSALEEPEVQGIERVFPNFMSLTADEKKVVRLGVAPFARYLDRMAKEGATHTILPLYRHLTDMEGMTPWKGEPTFDGRSYDAVRGAAGKTAVTGVETLWPATRMSASTFAHEFAHQVHNFGLSGEQKTRVTMLYRRAKKEGRCLDFYAAENEQEYFAQAYEAFISPFKRPTSSETGKNTRDDLARKDPECFRFLLEITGEGTAAPEDE